VSAETPDTGRKCAILATGVVAVGANLSPARSVLIYHPVKLSPVFSPSLINVGSHLVCPLAEIDACVSLEVTHMTDIEVLQLVGRVGRETDGCTMAIPSTALPRESFNFSPRALVTPALQDIIGLLHLDPPVMGTSQYAYFHHRQVGNNPSRTLRHALFLLHLYAEVGTPWGATKVWNSRSYDPESQRIVEQVREAHPDLYADGDVSIQELFEAYAFEVTFRSSTKDVPGGFLAVADFRVEVISFL